ncbi:MAG: 50S ribosomal protein L29 [Candidatus Bathyarchaeota archaeon]|nr:50S ribosomal protein L29 [Candidatus Bathyarchaeota archaeon]
MPILRVKEIRDMSSEDRAQKLKELRTEFMRMKTMIGAGGTVEDPARIKELRRTIARLLTIEKEQQSQPAAAKRKRVRKKK